MLNKPVWRLNTGSGVPSDLVGNIMYRDGFVLRDLGRWLPGDKWEIDSCAYYDIYAYQTNRTRKAKYGLNDE